MTVGELWDWQKAIRALTIDPTLDWQQTISDRVHFGFIGKKIEDYLVLEVASSGSGPYMKMIPLGCRGALMSTVFIDRWQGDRYKVCARRDCGKIFLIEDGHKRKFHIPYCGHVEAVRRSRRREKERREKEERLKKGADVHL